MALGPKGGGTDLVAKYVAERKRICFAQRVSPPPTLHLPRKHLPVTSCQQTSFHVCMCRKLLPSHSYSSLFDMLPQKKPAARRAAMRRRCFRRPDEVSDSEYAQSSQKAENVDIHWNYQQTLARLNFYPSDARTSTSFRSGYVFHHFPSATNRAGSRRQ